MAGVIVMIFSVLHRHTRRFAPYFTEMALKGGFSFAGESAHYWRHPLKGNMFSWSISGIDVAWDYWRCRGGRYCRQRRAVLT